VWAIYRLLKIVLTYNLLFQNNSHVKHYLLFLKLCRHIRHKPTYMALLSFRSTPIPWCSLSPAELLIGRKIRTDIPISKTQLTPQWSYLEDFQERDREYKAKQKQNYDQRHRTRPLDPLPVDTPVWIRTRNDHTPGQIRSPATTPRSYIVTTPDGELRRTRQHLIRRSPMMTCSRSGIALRPPEKLTL